MDPVQPEHASDFMPTVSEEYAERIRLWHERSYQEGRSEGKSEQTFSYLGLTIVVPPEVDVVASGGFTRDGWKVEYFTFLVT